MNLSPQLPNGKFCVQQCLRGERPECYQNLRPNQFDLTYQVRATGRNLLGKRISVPGRPMLQDVDDEYVLARKLYGRQNLLEQLPGLADERPARFILGRARGFAHEHEVSARIAFTGHGILGRRVERAACARRDGLLEHLERVETRAAGAEQVT